MKYKEISKYPSVKKDISIVVDREVTNEMIAKAIKKAASSLLIDTKLFDIYKFYNIFLRFISIWKVFCIS